MADDGARYEREAAAALATIDEDGVELGRLARLIAGDDERLRGQVSRALTAAYFLGRQSEWNDYLARTFPHPATP